MLDENSAGASYLAALKRSSAPQAAAAAPAQSAETATGSSIPPDKASSAGAEKRRSPRYRCQGSAHLREINGGAATWATFTDIGLHGCYVEAAATYRVGAALAVTLELNGFRVECRGEVRVSYPNLGMGIFFTTMSEEVREQLRDLLRSLRRPSVILGIGVAPRAPSVPPPDALPLISNPKAAVQAVISFFEGRQILTREEFFRILRKSQNPGL
jgi:hypothetical protein